MMKYILIFISTAVLIYGGVIDFKRREIPNAVPVILLVVGIFLNYSLIRSIMGLLTSAVLLLAAAKITKSEIPGGDFKLICSYSFAFGLPGLAVTICIAGAGAVIFGFVKHLPVKRHIPLCSYIAPAYIAFQAISLMLGR